METARIIIMPQGEGGPSAGSPRPDSREGHPAARSRIIIISIMIIIIIIIIMIVNATGRRSPPKDALKDNYINTLDSLQRGAPSPAYGWQPIRGVTATFGNHVEFPKREGY